MAVALQLLLLISVLYLGGCDEVRFVAVFFRHGARSPIAPFPDLDKRLSWPHGYLQLTPLGQRQHYLLGSALRKKYITDLKFLSEKYNRSELYVRSTTTERTIMSAQSMTVGLYPESLERLSAQQLAREEIWTPPFNLTISDDVKSELKNSSLPYDTPIVPIVSFNKSYDRLLSFDSCPKYQYLRDAFYKTEAFRSLYKKYNSTIQSICSTLNLDCSSIDGHDVFLFIDHILSSEFDGQLPELREKQAALAVFERGFAEFMLREESVKPVMNAIAFHDFYQTVSAYINTAMLGSKSARKMVLFSTHDYVLLAYLLALGFSADEEWITVPFASHMILELVKRTDGTYYVNLSYNGKALISAMNYAEFEEKIRKVAEGMKGSWEENCKIPELQTSSPAGTEGGNTMWLWTAGIAVLAVVIAAVLVGGRMIMQKMRRQTLPEIQTPTKKPVAVAV